MSKEKKEAKKLSRRDFMKGAAAGSAGVAGAGMLGGAAYLVKPAQAAMPPEPPCPVRETDPEDVKPIPPIDPPRKWDKEADIVVVGSGGGAVAAARAAEAGNKVIVLEKMGEMGGTTSLASAFRCWGSRWQREAGYTWDLEEVLRDYYERETRWSSNPKQNRRMLYAAEPCLEWFNKKLGIEWAIVDQLEHYVWAPNPPDNPAMIHCTMGPVYKDLEKYIRTIGVEILLRTACSKLVQKDGRIVGVEATNLDGDKIYVKAKKSVILSAGSFPMNRNMLKKWVPTAHRCVGNVCMVLPSHTGEVTRMAQGVGADMDGLDSFFVFDGGIDLMEVGGPWFRFIYSGDVTLARQSWLLINQGCERFMAVDNRGDHMHTRGFPLMAQPGARAFMIFDDNWQTDVFKFKGELDRKPTTKEDKALMPDMWPPELADIDWLGGVKEAIDMGAIRKADTLEELAEKLGLNPNKLVAVVERYNGYADSGKDPEFNKAPYLMLPIRKPPFYGLKTTGCMGPANCGVRINTSFQVVNADLDPIPGLYATYFTAGGLEGQSNMGGTTLMSCLGAALTSGFLAGAEAAKEKPWV